MYVIVLPPMDSGRLDSKMLGQVASIAAAGKPTLVCINQFSRYTDWCDNATEAKQACQDVLNSILELVPTASAFLQVYLTEFMKYQAHIDDMQARNIRNVEDVSYCKVMFVSC